MLPPHLIVDFWLRVQDLLKEEHHVSREKAQKGISEYLAFSELHEFTDMIYHRDPEDIARTIAAAVKPTHSRAKPR